MGLAVGVLAKVGEPSTAGHSNPIVLRIQALMVERGVRKLVLDLNTAVQLGLRTSYVPEDSRLTVRRSTAGPWQCYTQGEYTFCYWSGR